MIDRFFDGEMEQAQFEESVRYLFVTDGYLLFTVDKITQSLVKQIQNVSSDHQSINLLRLFRDNQGQERMASYRSDALANINSDENVFLISFVSSKKKKKLSRAVPDWKTGMLMVFCSCFAFDRIPIHAT